MKVSLNTDGNITLHCPSQSGLGKLVFMEKLMEIDEAIMLDNRQLATLDKLYKTS